MTKYEYKICITNTIIRPQLSKYYLRKIPSKYEYEYYLVWENHPNMNNIQVEKSPEYEY